MTRNKRFYIIFVFLIVLIAIIAKYFNLFLDLNIEKNISKEKSAEIETLPIVPNNYTLESYELVEVLSQDCKSNLDCETPMNYLLRSNCPYTSLCLNNKCTVVCPNPSN